MSKEEVLSKRIIKFPTDENMVDEAIKRNVYAAMEEYAHNEVIAFIKWYFLEAPKMEVENFDEGLLFVDSQNNKITKEQIYELYIQSKQKPEEKPKYWEVVRYGYAQSNDGSPDLQYIDSVRRLSDGLVLEIGATYMNEDTRWVLKPVKKFFEQDGIMYAQFNEGFGNNDGCLGINCLAPLPKVIPIKNEPPQPQVEEKPKDWQVIELRKGNISFGRQANGLYDIIGMPFIDEKSLEFLLSDKFDIHSVRRLSDGEVFTIGDKRIVGESFEGKMTITGFDIYDHPKEGVMLRAILNPYPKSTIADSWKQYHNILKISKSKEPPVDKEAFVWTDELVREYAHNVHLNLKGYDMRSQRESVQNFKQFKTTPKQEVCELRFFNFLDGKIVSSNEFIQFPPEKYEAIKKIIEETINKK